MMMVVIVVMVVMVVGRMANKDLSIDVFMILRHSLRSGGRSGGSRGTKGHSAMAACLRHHEWTVRLVEQRLKTASCLDRRSDHRAIWASAELDANAGEIDARFIAQEVAHLSKQSSTGGCDEASI